MSSPPTPDFSGTLLAGRYRVTRTLGRGGMGAVYEAVQEDLGRRVAVKVLHPHLALSPDVVERFRREAQAAAALGHPNIVQVTDFQWRAGEPLFLVMELLSGASLGAVMQAQGALPPARAAFIGAQVLGALAAAHRAGVVHRDVKPDNVFLTSTAAVHDFVKVLDFGVAKLMGEGPDAALTTTGMAIGTPYYMAPEQARGRPVDPRTDIYAVGVVLYHALSGRLPFGGKSFNELMFAIAEQTPTPLASLRPDLDPRLVAVVERAMQRDPQRRFQRAEEMQTALAPWAQPTTSTQPPPPMTLADPTAPTMQAFGGTRAPPMNAGSAPPPPKGFPFGLVLGLLVALFLVGGGVAVAYVKLAHKDDARTASSAASTAPAASSAPAATASVASGSEDAGVKDGGAAKHAALQDAAAPVVADAAPPIVALKPSAYLGSINVVGSTYASTS